MKTDRYIHTPEYKLSEVSVVSQKGLAGLALPCPALPYCPVLPAACRSQLWVVLAGYDHLQPATRMYVCMYVCTEHTSLELFVIFVFRVRSIKITIMMTMTLTMMTKE